MNKYKILYNKGLITKEQLLKIVQKGILTQAEYEQIVGYEK